VSVGHIDIFSELGEGVYWDRTQRSLFWLDINNYKLFKSKDDKVSSYNLVEKASAVLHLEGSKVFLASASGIVYFCLNSKKIVQVSEIPIEYAGDAYRANDGLRLGKELYMYGVMRDKPIKNDGALILSRSGVDKVIHTGVSIPNTFIKIPNSNSLLITDSLEAVVYKIDFNDSWLCVKNKVKWLNLSHTNATPDGGCISSNGRIFLSIWGGFKILELNLDGELISEFKVPVSRPTNCTLNTKEDQLFVTSAYEGLSDHDRKKYPLSGSILTIDIQC
jgi:sugar lactone lactonase YvrE